MFYVCGRDSSVGIATLYGLDGPGDRIPVVVGGSETFRTNPDPPWGGGAHPASCTMFTGSFPEVKRPGRGADPYTIFSAQVLIWVEIYLYLS
jgi:hypothetical protein